MDIRFVTIHQSLVQPLLLGGAERKLTLANALLILVLTVGGGFNLKTLLLAAILATVVQGFIVWMAKKDPQMLAVWTRHQKYQAYYPPQAKTDVSTPQIPER